MGCCGSTTTGAGAAPLDTGKRVNYTKGMLLGVDDFVQEQAWHIARRHELAREVLGYGTVRGLQVAAEGAPPRVRVTPGVALMPSGTPVCVPSEQCCDINGWLAKQWDQGVGAAVGALPAGAALPVYVVLAYDSCLTDLLPVPGEPCRSEDELTAASRVADCFRLELRLRPPEQVEENAIRDFADWLAQVPVDSISPPLTDSAFLARLRAAAQAWLTPGSPPPGDFMLGSPPVGLDSTDALLRAALRLWVTELRPLWRAKYGCGPHPVAPGGSDDAVLLAALQISLTGREAQTPVALVEDARPVLLSLRMLQELITQNPAPEPAQAVLAADRFGLPPEVGVGVAYARADHRHGTPTLNGDAEALDVGSPGVQEVRVVGLRGDPIAAQAPVADDVLVFDGSAWSPRTWPLPGAGVTAEQHFGQTPDAGTAATATFAKSDHTHGTPALRGDVEAVDVGSPAQQEVRVLGLRGVVVDAAPPTTVGHVLTVQAQSGGGVFWKAAAPPAPPLPGAAVAQTGFGLPKADGTSNAYARADHTHGTPALTGDVVIAGVSTAAGTFEEARVVRLQGRPVSGTEPLAQQVLTFNGTAWAPAALAGGSPVPPLGGDLSGAVTSAFVESLQKVPLKAATPSRGDVLTFDGRSWVPAAGGGTAGAFVEREAGPYRIVAAGQVRVELTDVDAGNVDPLPVRSVYSGLKGEVIKPPRAGSDVRLRFFARVTAANNDKASYIAKLTPVWTREAEALDDAPEFQPYLVEEIRAPKPDTIEFVVRLRLSQKPTKGQVFGLQVEVSRFEA